MNKAWVAAALLLCSTLCAAEDRTFVAVHGFDRMSCEDWLGSENNADVRQQYIAWIRGAVTGFNYATPNDQVGTGRMPTDFGLTIFVDNFCHTQRNATVSAAAFALIAERRGSSAVRVLNDQNTTDTKPAAKPDTRPDARTAVKPDARAAAKPAQGDDSLGFHDWLARQSDDIKSLGADLQKSIYRKEMALKASQ